MNRPLSACALLLPLLAAAPGRAEIPLYAQHLPEGTVYVRLVNAMPAAASVTTNFAGTVELGGDGAERVSPYFVAGEAGGKQVSLGVASGGKTATAGFAPKSGSFVSVVLHPTAAGGVAASVVTDTPDYNQLKARLSFYNATPDCAAGSLSEGSRPVFKDLAPESGTARSINPVDATVVASCAAGKAAPLKLGKLEAGGLYTVWMMQPAPGAPISFMAPDRIAPPRS